MAVTFFAFCIVPKHSSATVVSNRVHVVSDAVAFVIQKIAILCCPANLHDTVRYQQSLIIPDATLHLERASNTLKRICITSCLLKENRRFSNYKCTVLENKINIICLSSLTSKPLGEIFRYSLTSFVFNITFMPVISTASYEYCRPSIKTASFK